jgi:hypothetical protein
MYLFYRYAFVILSNLSKLNCELFSHILTQSARFRFASSRCGLSPNSQSPIQSVACKHAPLSLLISCCARSFFIFQGCFTVQLSRFWSVVFATAHISYHIRSPLSTTFFNFFFAALLFISGATITSYHKVRIMSTTFLKFFYPARRSCLFWKTFPSTKG